VRELTRLLDEQINSIRRELDNLKTIGLVKSRIKDRKKFFIANKNFLIFNELQNIIEKTSEQNNEIVVGMKKIGNLKFLLTTGVFTDTRAPIDLLIVGDFGRENLANYVKSLENKASHSIMYTSMTTEDFLFRKKVNDGFLESVFKTRHNILYSNLPVE